MPATACNVAATSIAIAARTVYSCMPVTRDDAAADGAAEAGPAGAISPAAAAVDNNSRRVIDVFAWRFPLNLI